MRRLVLALGVLLAASPLLAEDLVVFVNGDRLSGRIAAVGTKRVRLRTPYGRLEIPRDRIERLVWEDGREEIVTDLPETPPPEGTIRLLILVRGSSFWHAWDPGRPPEDPSLRLTLRLDGRTLGSFTDVTPDPDDLPGAAVNSFVFDPARLLVAGGEGVAVEPPESGSGGIRLSLRLPRSLAGDRWLDLAYQVNDGSAADPRWRDVVEAGTSVALSTGLPVRVQIDQERGLMEYADRGMRAVETFRVIAREIEPPG